ncbi:MAG: hypothetical protein ACTSYM_14075 [Candidatus Baldrarchaeia archaeon]
MQALVGMNLLENGYNVVFKQELKGKNTFYKRIGVTGITKGKEAGSRREGYCKIDVVAWKRTEILGVEVKTRQSLLKNGEKKKFLKQITMYNEYARAYDLKFYVAIPFGMVNRIKGLLRGVRGEENVGIITIDSDRKAINFTS